MKVYDIPGSTHECPRCGEEAKRHSGGSEYDRDRKVYRAVYTCPQHHSFAVEGGPGVGSVVEKDEAPEVPVEF
jgi:hypothetical protein